MSLDTGCYATKQTKITEHFSNKFNDGRRSFLAPCPTRVYCALGHRGFFLGEFFFFFSKCIYSLSTNRKNPLLFFWSIDNALTAISCRGGSPFCPLSRSTSNSMWEYANKPIRHTDTTVSFIWLRSAVSYRRRRTTRVLLYTHTHTHIRVYIYCMYQQPIFWAVGQPRIVTRHRFRHNSRLVLKRFQKVPFQKY